MSRVVVVNGKSNFFGVWRATEGHWDDAIDLCTGYLTIFDIFHMFGHGGRLW